MNRFLSLLLIIAAQLAPQACLAIDLQQALQAFYQNNPQIKANREGMLANYEELRTSYAGFLPSIVASYSKHAVSSKNMGNSTNTTGGSNGEGGGNLSHDPEVMQISVNQPVFRGGRSYHEYRRAKNSVKSAYYQFLAQEQEITLQAIFTYLDLIQAGEILQLAINNENILQKRLNASLAQFELGEVTQTAVALAKSRLAEASSEKIQSQGNLEIARANFYRVFAIDVGIDMGESIDAKRARESEEAAEFKGAKGNKGKDFVMQYPLMQYPLIDKTNQTHSNLKELLDYGMKNNPNVKMAEYSLKMQESYFSAKKSEILPEVSLNASYRKFNNNNASGSNNKGEESSIGIVVNVPLFQKGVVYSGIRQASKQKQQAKFEKLHIYNLIREDITESYHNLNTARAKKLADAKNLASNKIALEGIRREYEAGSHTMLDMLDSEQEYFKAGVNFTTAKINELKSYYNLRLSMGNLTAKDLQLEDYHFKLDVN